MKATTLLLLFALTISLSAQLLEITKFPMQESTYAANSSIVELDNELLFFWIENAKLKVSKSSDGVNWNSSETLVNSLSLIITGQDLVTNKTTSGKVLVTYKAYKADAVDEAITEYHIISSTDKGVTWTDPKLLINTQMPGTGGGKLSQTNDNKLWFAYNRSTILEYITSDDDGNTWSAKTTFKIGAEYLTAISVNDSLKLFYSRSGNILCNTSGDGGSTWVSTTILDDSNIYSEPSVVKKNDGTLVLIYLVKNATTIGTYYVIESTDMGITWTSPKQFTKYCGLDTKLRINSNSEKMYASFASDRFSPVTNIDSEVKYYKLWYGIVGVSDDVFTPPTIQNISNYPEDVSSSDTIKINAIVYDDVSVSKVYFNCLVNDVEQTPLEMFDDGLHNDGMANDSLYGVEFSDFSNLDIITYSVSATDNIGNFSELFGGYINISLENTYETYRMLINRFNLPFDNKGVLVDVNTDSSGAGGRFDEEVFLYSAGFGLSGIGNNEVWGNAVMSASRIEDYQPGIVGSEKDNLRNVIYVIKKEDEPFGLNWQTWKYAVELGANFYDGNEDGVYSPVDLNSNGEWDANEDCPDLIGDVMAWTVFNDGLPSALRRYTVDPKDIEIQQTVFGYSPNTYSELDGVLFVRYRIENKSIDDYESVYFSAMSDPDVGSHDNDLVGCDTLINAGYAYDKALDAIYGNSPTFMPTIIQGAPAYISGETFTDNNSNGIYDEGIDTPLDTAKYLNGKYFDNVEFVGARSQKMTSFTQYMSSHPTHGDPQTHIELREYMLGGHGKAGDSLYVSDWDYGNGAYLGADTVNIPAQYMYSGNPVTQEGWLNIIEIDQRMMVSSGPFTLKSNEPVEIIVAYAVGRGNTSLESIDVTKQLAKNAIGFYNTNFEYVPVGVKEKPQTQLPTEYSLSQNYPNPFNPSTTIKYSIPSNAKRETANTKLVIFDILGREVKTLVNTEQRAGNYEVNFNASNLTSGVYFYRLQSGSFIESKKMILLR